MTVTQAHLKAQVETLVNGVGLALGRWWKEKGAPLADRLDTLEARVAALESAHRAPAPADPRPKEPEHRS